MIGGRRTTRPLYMISVAAGLSGLHPQTLRVYERRRLINPQRSAGNTRLYSDADIERLRLITRLTQDEGVNLAGVQRIIELEDEVAEMRSRLEKLNVLLDDVDRRVERERERVHRSYRAEIVQVRRGGIVPHGGREQD